MADTCRYCHRSPKGACGCCCAEHDDAPRSETVSAAGGAA